MAVIDGTDGNDNNQPGGNGPLTGTEGDDVIRGFGGSDDLFGNGGSDTIDPGLGDSQNAYGGSGGGIDTLRFDWSSLDLQVIYTEYVVNGTIVAYHYDTVSSGGASQLPHDVNFSQFERYELTGSATQINWLHGAALDDVLIGGAAADQLYSFARNDAGASGNDTIDIGKGGATAATTAVGGLGYDLVQMGGGGDDLLIADYSAATEAVTFGFHGSSGAADYFSNSNTGARYGAVGKLNFTGVERFTVKTGSAADTVLTGDNADTISSGGGDDTLDSRKGYAAIDGGTGTDTWGADFSGTSPRVVINVNLAGEQMLAGNATVTGIETLSLVKTGLGNDVLTTHASGAYSDSVDLGGGSDIVTVGGGATAAVTAVGGPGHDLVQMGAGGDDLLIADYSAATEAVTFGFHGSSAGALDYFSNSNTGARYGAVGKLNFTGVERFTVKTGAAADTVLTGDNADTISSGGGDDTLDSRAGRATIDGGAGTDIWAANLSLSNAAIVFNLNLGGTQRLAEGSTVRGIEAVNVTTGSGNDVITTLAGRITLTKGAPSDTVNTGAGDDVVTIGGGATAASTALGGLGHDLVQMGAGGDDLLIADYSAATEAITFGFHGSSAGAVDYFSNSNTGARYGAVGKLNFTGVERFSVKTGSAADNVTTGDNDDTVSTGAGDDRIYSGKGAATIDGGTGVDTWSADLSVRADGSAVTTAIRLNLNVLGTQRLADGSTVVGIESVRLLEIGSGDDVITTHPSGLYQDVVNTGIGNDIVTVTGAATGAATAGRSIDAAHYDSVQMGEGGDDLLIADYSAATEAVTFRFHAFSAGAKDYRTLSSDGADYAGVGKLAYTGVERFSVTTGSEADSVTTGDNADAISTGRGNDTLRANDGNDVLEGGIGADVIDGGLGRDTASYQNARALADGVTGVTVDLLAPSTNRGEAVGDTLTGIEILRGSRFDDTFSGSDAGDFLYGEAGADRLSGQGGGDLLQGGAGKDTLDGGAGRDTFVFGGPLPADGAFGVDTIDNFEDRAGETTSDGLDRIDLTAFRSANGGTALSFADDLLIKQVGADTVIWLDLDGNDVADSGNRVILTGIDDAQIGAVDFLL